MSNNRLDDLLNLSTVPRWSVVPVLRTQSVAEHTFRVIVIVTELCRKVRVDALFEYRAMQAALVHDAPESETGDIPYTCKVNLPEGVMPEVEDKMCPWISEDELCRPSEHALVKIADVIDWVLFLREWGNINSDRCVKALVMAESLVWEHTFAARSRFGWNEITGAVETILKSPPPEQVDNTVTGWAAELKGRWPGSGKPPLP